MNKYNYNFHTHTKRCGHASGEDEEYVLEAIKAGIKTLGFSDHVPYTKHISPTERMRVEEFENYRKSILDLKEKYKDKIEILLGLEIEYFINDLDEIKEHASKVDYVILGQHESTIPNGHSVYRDSEDEVLLEYAHQLEEALDIGLVKYLAHPDLFMFAKDEWDEICDEVSNIIISAAKRNNAVLEVNMGGIRRGLQPYKDGMRFRYPVKQFWEIAKSYDVDIVVGVDAHQPENFNDKEAYRALDEFLSQLKIEPLVNYDIRR